MEDLLKLIDPQALKERQETIARSISRGGSEEIARYFAALSLLAERVLYESDVNRRSLDLINIPIASGILDGHMVLQSVRITAESPFDSGAGFHNLEHDSAGLPFRWTGPAPQFRIELMVDRSSARRGVLRMLNSGHLTAAYLGVMRIYVDGKLCPARASLGQFAQLEFSLPKRESSIASTSIVAECAVWSPSETEGSADTRRLGVPFFDLLIEPE